MKNFKKYLFLIYLIVTILLCGCTKQPSNNNQNANNNPTECQKHSDSDNNGVCDTCYKSVFVYFDFYAINDLHGKFDDDDTHPGVDELTTYLKKAREKDEYAIFISAGDMWQGSAESNLTKGLIMTEWMNDLDFAAMALGNHEYDWGEEYIKNNSEMAEFPFLAINIYDRKTNQLVDYCEPSVMVECGGMQIGIIGAIGDCYSSIASEKCEDVYFKVGQQLTALVKAESEALRQNGADFIVYVLHDGYEQENTGSAKEVSSSQISSYYDTSLSNGYVDLVFEGHTHKGYMIKDEYGVYHLQHKGDNKGGISHVEISINSVTNDSKVRVAELVSTSKYQSLEDDPIVDSLLEKYDDLIGPSKVVLGQNSSRRNGKTLCNILAKLYFEAGMKEWGNEYDIALGGGFMSARSPYYLYTGDVIYADLAALFPFDNQLVLCSISGRDLRSKFFETNNSDYYIYSGDYGNSIRGNIDNNATYYVIVDTYTAYYKPNRLTVVKEYDPNIFARDLLAEYVKNGGLK